jgi:hypothetical protein
MFSQKYIFCSVLKTCEARDVYFLLLHRWTIVFWQNCFQKITEIFSLGKMIKYHEACGNILNVCTCKNDYLEIFGHVT